jgi:hypothetical protein
VIQSQFRKSTVVRLSKDDTLAFVKKIKNCWPTVKIDLPGYFKPIVFLRQAKQAKTSPIPL